MTPVIPPTTNAGMNAIVHIIGVGKVILPLYIVNSQLKILTPVGIAIIIVVTAKNALTFAPEPIVKKW